MSKNGKEQPPLLQPHNEDNFFAEIANTKPFVKMGAHGFAGTGKTYTLALIAAGLHKFIKSDKPIVVFDTEESSKFLKVIFDEYKIVGVTKRSRSLADLKETFKRCTEGFSDILIIDSISHVWEDFLEAYKRKRNRQRIEFQDWGFIKPAWKQEFSDPFVRSPFHCFMTGRAGYEYESEVSQETGKREIYKSGVKMKVEGETAYEPDILLYMERFEELLADKKEVYRQATVVKGRSALIDGKVLKNPTFEDFRPVVEQILSKPADVTPVTEREAGDLFRTEEEKDKWKRRKDIALEIIEGMLTVAFPGQSAKEKKHKALAVTEAYGTTSWTEIQSKKPEILEEGHAKLQAYIDRVRQEEQLAV